MSEGLDQENRPGASEISSGRVRIVAAICTYRRNEPLRRLLEALLVCAERVRSQASLGVVVIDDTEAGDARCVASDFLSSFEGGFRYEISGKQNISLARNLAIETALPDADFIAMTDDDCQPAPNWLCSYLDALRNTGATAVTGPMARRFPPQAPRWLTTQPFGLLGVDFEEDLSEVTTGSTNNSMISASWLRRNPVRFDPELGVIGGEDMVFYRSARAAGLRIYFVKDAIVYEDQPASRSNLRYQVRRFFWQGNSSFVTCVQTGKSRHRMLLHGLASLARAGLRPGTRLLRGQSPQFCFGAALIAEGVGKISGYFGLRVKHH